MFTVIPTALDHAAALHAIEIESFADPWSVSAILYEISAPHSICLVAVDENGAAVGHVSMRHIINEGHIGNLAVSAAYRRQGVAAMLLEALVAEAVKREMIGLTLEVRVSNQAAIALYEKYGFVTEGYRKNYYNTPSEDAAIMWKKLNYNDINEVQPCQKN